MANIIFDNIIFSLQKAGGVSILWQNLLNILYKEGYQFRAIDYNNCNNNIFYKELIIPSEIIEHRNFLISDKIEQMRDVKVKGYTNPFIFHSSCYRICSNPLAINVTTVHDFTYEKGFSKIGFPEKIRMGLNHRAIKRSQHIVCISENTKRDMLNYIPGLDEDKISIIHNGVSDDYFTLNNPSQQYRDCILFVGGRQDYKNFKFAVNVACKSGMRLLICGNQLTENEKCFLREELGEDRYIFKLRPDNSELNKYYNSVHCLIYPSSYEGFGIPVIEAQKAGCPVIALNASSIPEIVGEGGMLLDNISVEEAVSLIHQLDNNKYRNNLIKNGLDNSRKYSWYKMAMEYAQVYRSLLNI